MLALLVPAANAVVVHLPNGQSAGVFLRPGLSAAAFERQTGARALTAATRARNTAADPNGLFYNGGPVLHATDPYLVFWDPPPSDISSRSRQVMTQYLTDAGLDGSNPGDVYAYRVLPQYGDGTGPSAQGQTFSAASQEIPDSHTYPTNDPTICTSANQSGFSHCVTDAQLQAELIRLIGADHLPSGMGANAPIYFMVTPANVDVCINATTCSGGPNLAFCAYHSNFALPSSNQVIYASIPFTEGANCQSAGPVNPPTQEPNGDVADVITDNLSHENAEAITDPLESAWFTSNGEEVADQCEAYGPNDPNDPNGPTSPDAYMPTLGGSQANGTLYDQLINGDHYFTQTLWSNIADGCEATSTVSASFAAPGSVLPGVGATFDPSTSSSGNGYRSTTWDWGDGTAETVAAGAPTPTTHTFAAPGTYTVTLTLVDAGGNTSQTSHTVLVDSSPAAAFSASPSVAETGSPVTFNGAPSNDPNQNGAITGYSWNFGDGSPAGAGAAASHAYASPGNYTVTLTVTGNEGLTAAVSHVLTVVAAPVAVASVSTKHPVAGSPVSFNGAASSGGITAYAWNFGDHATGSGAAPRHTYAKPGTYTATLTVTDSAGFTSTRSLRVAVASPVKNFSLQLVRGQYELTLTLTAAGKVRVGSAKVTLKRPGKATLKLSLSGAQKQRLSAHKPVKLTIVYTPAHGAKISKTVAVKLKNG